MKFLTKSWLLALGIAPFILLGGETGAQVPDLSQIPATATASVSITGAPSVQCTNNRTGYGAPDYKVCTGPTTWELRFGAKDLVTCQSVTPAQVNKMQQGYEEFISALYGVSYTIQSFDIACSDGFTP